MGYTDPERQKQYQREWVARRRAKWFAENGPCVRCGSWEDLQLDHVDPAQKVHHTIWSWSRKRINEEVAKCQVLCGDCHKDKTWNEDGRRRAQHGTLTMYKNYKCRCEPCRAAKRVDNAARRKPRSLAAVGQQVAHLPSKET